MDNKRRSMAVEDKFDINDSMDNTKNQDPRTMPSGKPLGIKGQSNASKMKESREQAPNVPSKNLVKKATIPSLALPNNGDLLKEEQILSDRTDRVDDDIRPTLEIDAYKSITKGNKMDYQKQNISNMSNKKSTMRIGQQSQSTLKEDEPRMSEKLKVSDNSKSMKKTSQMELELQKQSTSNENRLAMRFASQNTLNDAVKVDQAIIQNRGLFSKHEDAPSSTTKQKFTDKEEKSFDSIPLHTESSKDDNHNLLHESIQPDTNRINTLGSKEGDDLKKKINVTPIGPANLNNESSTFKYNFITNDKNIRIYKENEMTNERFEEIAQDLNLAEGQNQLIMKPLNETAKFNVPISDQGIQQATFDHLKRNTYVRYIDNQDDPQSEDTIKKLVNAGKCVIKDIRNVHISEDHQRAYVWTITTTCDETYEPKENPRQLWLQVYNLAAHWASHSTFNKEHVQLCQEIQSLREQFNKSHDLKVKNKLEDLQKRLYEDPKFHYKISNPIDEESEARLFHRVKNYESISDNEEQVPEAGRFIQKPMKQEFSILIGEFDWPKHEYLYDPIQSFYKQYVSDLNNIYFFVKENQEFYLNKLSAFDFQARKVIVEGSTIKLPFKQDSNQFAIVRPLDPLRSREMSCLNKMMFAILKEVQVGKSSKSRKSLNNLAPKFIESIVEIYQVNEQVPLLGTNAYLRQLPQEYDPQNIATRLKEAEDSDNEDQMPVNNEYEFCCWYLLDQEQNDLNFTVLLDKYQIVNMRTPVNQQSLVHIKDNQNPNATIVSKMHSLQELERPILDKFDIKQNMPIFAVDLREPEVLAQLVTFIGAATSTRLKWEDDIINRREKGPCALLGNDGIELTSQNKLKSLEEIQTQMLENLSKPHERLYITITLDHDELQFESIYPLIPDYLWNSSEGQWLSFQIKKQLETLLKKYTEIKIPQYYTEEHDDKAPKKVGKSDDADEPYQYSEQQQDHSKNIHVKEEQDLLKVVRVVQTVAKCQVFPRHNHLAMDMTQEHCQCCQNYDWLSNHEQKLENGIMTIPKALYKVEELLNSHSVTQAQQAQRSWNKLAAQDKSSKKRVPRISKKDQLKSQSISSPRDILVTGSLKIPNDDDYTKVRLKQDMISVSADSKCFIHFLKYKKKVYVSQQEHDQTEHLNYRGKKFTFEEDFEYFDNEIAIGFLNLDQTIHMVNLSEQRDPFKRTQSILSQMVIQDGMIAPLQNPLSPYQRLIQDYDESELNKQELVKMNTFERMNRDIDYQAIDQRCKVRTLQVLSRSNLNIQYDENLENLTELRNLNAKDMFETLRDHNSRKSYFMSQLQQTNCLREVEWVRKHKFCQFFDYNAENNLAKFWILNTEKDQEDQEKHVVPSIGHIDMMQHIINQRPSFGPNANHRQDPFQVPKPNDYKVLRDLFLDQFAVQTVKQLKNNPQHMIVQLKHKRAKNTFREQNYLHHDEIPQVTIFITMDDRFESIKKALVLKQSSSSYQALKDFQKKQKPMQKEGLIELLETQQITSFVDDVIDINQGYPEQLRFKDYISNTRFVTFDNNFGNSVSKDIELMAMKMWKPLNSIKFFMYDFILMTFTELFEIPFETKQFDRIQNMQLIRIADENYCHALFVDFGNFKEVYLVEVVVTKVKNEHLKRHQQMTGTGRLIGKVDIISPNTVNHVLNTAYVTPLYKRFKSSPLELQRDGFIMHFGQTSMEFDYKYYSNIQGRDRIKFCLPNQSAIFNYEVLHSNQIKRNLHSINQQDQDFVKLLIIRTRINPDIPKLYFTENQKLKLLRYFAKTLQVHREAKFFDLLYPSLDHNLQSELIQPRQELFGFSKISLLLKDSAFRDQFYENTLKKLDTAFLSLTPESRVFSYKPNAKVDQIQNDIRFFELNMDMLSPISHAINAKYHVNARKDVDFFQRLLEKCDSNRLHEYSTIFYACCKQIISIGSIDLEQFMNPDGVGFDKPCELFQRTLRADFYPQFHHSHQTFVNSYDRSIETLERNQKAALKLDEFPQPHQQDNSTETQGGLHEVQYGFIDLDWVNILNCLDQKSYEKLIKIQKKQRGDQEQFDIYKEILRLQNSKRPFLETILAQKNLSLFNYRSIMLLIDHGWYEYAREYFLVQLLVYLIFFLIPFFIDLYYTTSLVFPYKEINSAHYLFQTVAICTQLIFFFGEIIQLKSKGEHYMEYLFDAWNWNDLTHFLTYLIAVTLMRQVTSENMSGEDIAAVKIFYTIVLAQTFFKLCYLLRVFEQVGLMIKMIGMMVQDLQPFLVLGLVLNLLFAFMYWIVGVDLPDEYSHGWSPIVWLAYSLRNAVGDYESHQTNGFLPQLIGDQSNLNVYGSGRGTVLHLIWVIWIFNVVAVSIILMSILISVVIQAYENILSDSSARIYQQRTELLIESQLTLSYVGLLQTKEFQGSVIIRKKKFANDIHERLKEDGWPGFTQSIKNYLDFKVIRRIEHLEQQNDETQKQVKKSLQNILMHLESQENQHRQEKSIFMGGGDMSKITYRQSLHNVTD